MGRISPLQRSPPLTSRPLVLLCHSSPHAYPHTAPSSCYTLSPLLPNPASSSPQWRVFIALGVQGSYPR